MTKPHLVEILGQGPKRRMNYLVLLLLKLSFYVTPVSILCDLCHNLPIGLSAMRSSCFIACSYTFLYTLFDFFLYCHFFVFCGIPACSGLPACFSVPTGFGFQACLGLLSCSGIPA